jgi:membrane-associated phospholipid phosphatase
LVIAVAWAYPLKLQAQQTDLAMPPQPTVLRWWHGVAVLGGVSALMLLDQPTQRYIQSHRSETVNQLSGVFRRFGQIEVYGTVSAGVLAAGMITGNESLTRSGARLAAALALAGSGSVISKLALGRPRPTDNPDADEYVPFSGREAMPSGHTAVAFAMATTLADEIDRTWASIGLYTIATGVGWSRLNENRHWVTDVAAGAVLGITSAKLVSGRWRIFGLRPPDVLLTPRPGIAWHVAF